MRRPLLLSALLVISVLGTDAIAEAALHVPRGVRVATVARKVGNPTNIAFDPAGGMWTTSATGTNGGSDGVWYTPRAGGASRQVVGGLFSALGLAWRGGELFVSYQTPTDASAKTHHGVVDAFSGFDGQGFGRRRRVLSNLPVGRHGVDSIAPGPGGRLYMGIGSVFDSRGSSQRLSSTVVSFLPRGRSLRVEGRGFRNPYGLAFVPGTGDLLVTDNARDDLGPFRPPDELNLVRPAGGARFFGFPGCYGQGGRACRGVTGPLARLDAHASADGVAVARRFGTFGRSAFIAENGSSFVENPTGSNVVRVSLTRLRNGGYSARRHAFAYGFRAHDPLGAAIGPGGALYVTLFISGEVVRFSPGR